MRSITRKSRDIFALGRVVPSRTLHAASEMPPIVHGVQPLKC